MTPTINASLKAAYAAYCAEQRARHYTPVSYELWLEGTVNALQLDLANAKRALHLPDAYRAALEATDKQLEDLMAILQKELRSRDRDDVQGDRLKLLVVIEQTWNRILETRNEIVGALGGAEEGL